jgi:hypothetical protein
MKRICTQFALFCLLIVGQNLSAQSLTIGTSNPLPTPGFGAADNVAISNGFTSTNTGTFNDFAPFQTDTIVSPLYYYTTSQSTIYFAYNCSAAASGVDATPKVLIITQSGDTVSASSSQEFTGATTNYYFTFHLATPLPANTVFKIALIMTLGPKAVNAATLATNALRTTAQSPVTLAVKFKDLYAKKSGNGISVTWTVTGEINTTGYEVQRSTNGSTFATIGFVAASNKSSYSFVDSKNFETSSYRIKSIDPNSNIAYSGVVNIYDQQYPVVLKAFPMPVQSELTIDHGSSNTTSKLELLSVDGRMIRSISIAAGVKQTSVDFSAVKAGVYVVRFVNNNKIESLKIVKQ